MKIAYCIFDSKCYQVIQTCTHEFTDVLYKRKKNFIFFFENIKNVQFLSFYYGFLVVAVVVVVVVVFCPV